MAAGAAQRQGCVTAAIEEQQRLLTGLQRRGELADQWRREKTPALDALAPHIDEPHDRKLGRRMAARQCHALVAAARHIDHGFERRCGRDQDYRDAGQGGAQHRHVAGLVDDPILLLVGGVVLLVHDDQPELGEGEEQRGTGADDHAAPARRDRPPSVTALRGRHIGMPLLGERPEALAKPLQPLCAEGDLRQQHEHLPSGGQRRGERGEIGLGLAGAGNAVEHGHPKGVRLDAGDEPLRRNRLIGRECRTA